MGAVSSSQAKCKLGINHWGRLFKINVNVTIILGNVLLEFKCIYMYYKYIAIFCWKNCIVKDSHFFSNKKITVYLIIKSTYMLTS